MLTERKQRVPSPAYGKCGACARIIRRTTRGYLYRHLCNGRMGRGWQNNAV